ncbi:hypothetical protein IR012_05585 [Pseudomonas putida]|uniref:hypothetical protein n=1 Tax=Pseudomonas putida TaxID=303 RepID=UPI0018A96A43|nr:hypothetical protein [Pseudomonas putida]MBF8668282.1 hypothetical protein [Pseudomonas putida]MBF8711782.1 hypothetical protein [Pseudomonas putida]
MAIKVLSKRKRFFDALVIEVSLSSTGSHKCTRDSNYFDFLFSSPTKAPAFDVFKIRTARVSTRLANDFSSSPSSGLGVKLGGGI